MRKTPGTPRVRLKGLATITTVLENFRFVARSLGTFRSNPSPRLLSYARSVTAFVRSSAEPATCLDDFKGAAPQRCHSNRTRSYTASMPQISHLIRAFRLVRE